jgi:hypothetical protein
LLFRSIAATPANHQHREYFSVSWATITADKRLQVMVLTVYQLPLREIQGLEELKQVEIRLREVCHGEDKWTTLFSAVLQGGKRLRPALVVLCGSFLPAPRGGTGGCGNRG